MATTTTIAVRTPVERLVPPPLYTLSTLQKIGRLLLELVKFSFGREQ